MRPRGRYAVLLDQARRDILLTHLAALAGNVTHVARSLDLDVRHVRRELRRLGVAPGTYRTDPDKKVIADGTETARGP